MRVAFAGTPEFAATVLKRLVSSDHEVGLVISQPDARRGRGRKTSPPPVAVVARDSGLPLLQPPHISQAAGEISRHDVLVVVAYGQILRPDTLYAARHGAYNVHASLLPAYRGAAPIERAITNGERRTGVTIMKMDEGLDSGPIALQRAVEITDETTGGELTDTLAHTGAEAIVEALTLLEAKTLNLTPQDSLKATYAAKLAREEQVIRWECEAKRVHDLVRALSPHIGARTFHPDFEGPIKIWRSRVVTGGVPDLQIGEIYAENRRILVGCAEGALEVLELQVPGARRMGAEEFLRGNTLRGALRA